MRKLIAAAAAVLMLASGLGIASANNGNGPPFNGDGINPDHPAWYGLCTAWFNNSDQGKQNGRPFQALSDHFDDDEDAITDFCSRLRPSNGQGQGRQDASNAPAPGPRGNR